MFFLAFGAAGRDSFVRARPSGAEASAMHTTFAFLHHHRQKKAPHDCGSSAGIGRMNRAFSRAAWDIDITLPHEQPSDRRKRLTRWHRTAITSAWLLRNSTRSSLLYALEAYGSDRGDTPRASPLSQPRMGYPPAVAHFSLSNACTRIIWPFKRALASMTCDTGRLAVGGSAETSSAWALAADPSPHGP